MNYTNFRTTCSSKNYVASMLARMIVSRCILFFFESGIAFSWHSFLCVMFFLVISLQVLPHAHLSKLSRAKCQERFVSSPRGAPVCERPVERLNAVFTYFNYSSFLCFDAILILGFFLERCDVNER